VRASSRPAQACFAFPQRGSLAKGRGAGGWTRTLTGLPAGKGTLRWLCEQYFRSAEYKSLETRTQHVRRLILDAACMRDGDKPFALMEARHVRRRRDEKAEKPEAANAVVKALRQVFAFAIENDLAERNPAKDVPYLKSGSEGFHSWSIEEVRQFEERHAIGTT
jgi:site-specific recombinase XerD